MSLLHQAINLWSNIVWSISLRKHHQQLSQLKFGSHIGKRLGHCKGWSVENLFLWFQYYISSTTTAQPELAFMPAHYNSAEMAIVPLRLSQYDEQRGVECSYTADCWLNVIWTHTQTAVEERICWWNSYDFNDLMQDCSNSIANALELEQSCTKPLIW